MDACAARCSKWVYSWWLNPFLQWDAFHLIWACLKMGPPVMSIFGWENDDRAGGFGKNPSKSLNVQIPTHSAPPECSWCLKRSHFLHQPPSRISSIAFGEAAWLVQVLSWLLCWCWLQLPWPYLWLHTWAPPDQMKSSPGCTSKRE